MWRPGPDFSVWLGRDQARLERARSPGSEALEMRFVSMDGFIAEGYGQWLSSAIDMPRKSRFGRRPRVEIIIADGVCRLFALPALPPLRTRSEAIAWAALRFEALYESQASDWRLRVAFATRSPCIGAALPAPLIQGLLDVHARLDAPIHGFRPAFFARMAAVSRRQLLDCEALVHSDGNDLTYAWLARGWMQDIQQRRDAGLDSSTLSSVLARECLLQGRPALQRVLVLAAAEQEVLEIDATPLQRPVSL